MIIDGRRFPQDHTTDCDILIVGAGPAGISLALELEATGLDIVLLESGGLDFDDRAQELNDGMLSALDTTDLMAARLRLLGGASNHWGGNCLPLDDIDFDRAPLSGLSGWPMSRASLEEAYTRASVYCELGAFDYGLDTIEGLTQADLLMPEEDNIRTEVIRLSPPTNFGQRYLGALDTSEAIKLWLWTTATGLDIDASGTVNTVRTRNVDNTPMQFAASDVIVACGAVENARLLMANNIRIGASFGDAGGFLGACYMDHPAGGAAFLHLDSPVSQKALWSHGLKTRDGVGAHLVWRLSDAVQEAEKLNNTQFFLLPFSDNTEERRLRKEAGESLSSLKSIAKWVAGRPRENFSLSKEYCEAILNADALAVHNFRQWTGTRTGIDRLLLRYETEQLPDRGSYVALSDDTDALGMPKPILHWSPSLADRDSIVKSAMLIGTYAGARGIGRLELEDHFENRYWDASTAWHQMGTTRMSVAASDGVVDADCLLHGTRNLYVAGSSVFPSGGRANPTLTIVALSMRLADHLRGKRGA